MRHEHPRATSRGRTATDESRLVGTHRRSRDLRRAEEAYRLARQVVAHELAARRGVGAKCAAQLAQPHALGVDVHGFAHEGVAAAAGAPRAAAAQRVDAPAQQLTLEVGGIRPAGAATRKGNDPGHGAVFAPAAPPPAVSTQAP